MSEIGRVQLELLLLATVRSRPSHGYAIIEAIRRTSDGEFDIPESAMYPALHRLELRGDVASEMTASENNRRARVYTLTPAGRRRLAEETASWEQFALSIRRILQAG